MVPRLPRTIRRWRPSGRSWGRSGNHQELGLLEPSVGAWPKIIDSPLPVRCPFLIQLHVYGYIQGACISTFFPEISLVEMEKRLLAKNIPVSSGHAHLGLQSRIIPEPSTRWFWDTKLLFILGSLGTFGRVLSSHVLGWGPWELVRFVRSWQASINRKNEAPFCSSWFWKHMSRNCCWYFHSSRNHSIFDTSPSNLS